MEVKSEREVAQSCQTLHDPMGCSLPGSSARNANQNYHEVTTSHWSEWPSSKKSTKITAGDCMRERKLSYNVGEKVNWFSHYGEQYRGS